MDKTFLKHSFRNADGFLAILEENRMLKKEIRTSREAAEVTAKLVVKQFEETETVLQRFQVANAQRKAVLNSAAHISIIATNASGLITVFNTGARNLLGYTAKEILNIQKPELFHTEDELARHATLLEKKLGRAVPPDNVLFKYAELSISELMEWQYVRKDGSKLPVNMSINPLIESDGAIGGFLCVAHDISKRKEAEEALRKAHIELEQRVKERTSALAQANEQLQIKIKERHEAEKALRKSESNFRSLFENASSGIFQSSVEGRFITANPAMVAMLGYSSEKALLNSVHKIQDQVYVHPETRQEIIVAAGKTGRLRDFQTQAYRKDGSIIDVSINMVIVKDEQGNVKYYEGSVEDITQKKRADRLKIEKDAAEAATQAKSDFLANMSHEIRTPMNAIIGLTELALKTEMTPNQHDYLKKIHGSGHTLLGIINDILDFSKIEAGKLEMEEVEFQIDELMNNISDIFSSKVAEKGIELVMHVAENVPAKIVGDPMRLNQILINLVGNAVKFTQQGEVVVKTDLLKKDDRRVRLRFVVKDSGIGISKAFLPNLFSSFTQADDSTTRKYGGTGLGLTISRRLVNLMGGEITAESEEGLGTTITVTAEFSYADDREKKKTVVPATMQNKTILVVDNNETSRIIFTEILNSFTFKTKMASSGDEAIQLLETAAQNGTPYAMVLLDWRMPGKDGITTLEQIRNTDQISDTPVVMMTAYGREEVMQRADSAGADAFLIKPIKQSILFDTIMNVFHQPGTAPVFEKEDENKEALNAFEHLRGRYVLLVEDNLINQQVATEILQEVGIVVDVANNGKEALASVQKSRYDIVIMDVQMPEMDGYEATRHIRKEFSSQNLPIVAMTAHAMKGDREKCFESGMNEYITKPIDRTALFSALSKWMQPSNYGSDECSQAPKTESGRKEDLPEKLPGIDLVAAVKRIRNTSLLKKLLIEFSDKYAAEVEKLNACIRKNDLETAIRRVHTVKGVAGNFSASILYESAQCLETVLRHDKREELNPTLQKFSEALNTVVTSGRKLKTKPEEKAPKQSSRQAEPMMQQLHTLLKMNDFEAEECFELLTFHLDPSHSKEVKLLSDAINSLEYDTALKHLNSLAKKMEVCLGGPNG